MSGIGKTFISSILTVGLVRRFKRAVLFSCTQFTEEGKEIAEKLCDGTYVYKYEWKGHEFIVINNELSSVYEDYLSSVHEVRRYCLERDIELLIMDIPGDISYARSVIKGVDVLLFVYTPLEDNFVADIVNKLLRFSPHLVLIRNYSREGILKVNYVDYMPYVICYVPFIEEVDKVEMLRDLLNKTIDLKIYTKFSSLVKMIAEWCSS
ncbi:MAG: hypothetical protein DRZ82_05530 [Thermoprotei archaeon]|nr:MAG: hypothetical protein DRZ82_05530 [Thermoprotei archaeon]